MGTERKIVVAIFVSQPFWFFFATNLAPFLINDKFLDIFLIYNFIISEILCIFVGKKSGFQLRNKTKIQKSRNTDMTKEQRHQIIMNALLKKGAAQVTELADILQVSSVTIRKDLTELEKENKLYRSHGKAIMLNPFTNNRSVNEKEKLFTGQKTLIGREAAKLITNNDSIILASGTTVHALARNIVPNGRITVVSASLQVSETLSEHENIDILQLGGMLRHSSLSVVGEYSEMILKNCAFSKLYLGVDGIDFDFGFSTTDMREANLNRKMMHTAQKTIVLADSSKFGKRGFAKIGDTEEIDIIITDAGISPKDRATIEDLGIDLIIAK